MNIHKKINISILSISLLYSTNSFCVLDEMLADYSRIFTTKIYDQSTIAFNTLTTENQRKSRILRDLKRKKKEQIDVKCVQALNEELAKKERNQQTIKEVYDDLIEETKAHKEKGSWIKTGVDLFIAGVGGAVAGPFGWMIGQGVGSTITKLGDEYIKGDTSTELVKKTANAQIDVQEYQSIKQEMEKLTLLRNVLQEGIDKEPETLLAMEEEYVLRKRFFPAQMQVNIEDALIDARKTGISNLEKPEAFVQKALLLPFRENPVKELGFYNLPKPNADDIPNSVDFSIAFDDNVFFKGFSEGLRVKLKNVASNIRRLSSLNTTEPRRTYFFWGKPGVGKSTAAVEIPQFLKLPYIELTIRSEADLSKESIEGGARGWPNPQIGMFALALTASNSEGRSYGNPVLILNDFDRVLGNSSQALSFLLFFLDPKTKQFLNNYFGGNLDISKITTILTSRKKIPAGESYDALRDRTAEEIEFDPPNSETLTSILKDYKKEVLKQYEPNFVKNDWWKSMERKTDAAIPGLVQGEESIRKGKRKLEDNIGLQFTDSFNSLAETKRARRQ